MSDFDCITLSNDQYHLRGTSTFDVFGVFRRPHLCLEFHNVTFDKYYYYVATAIETTSNDRIYISNNDNPVMHDDVCNRKTPFELGSYVMLIKNGTSDTNLAMKCPSIILRNFENVKFRSSDGTQSCSGKLEILADRLKINYTYNSCDISLTFSVGGLWSCLYSTHSESTTYLAVLNMDAFVVRGKPYRIVCYTLRLQEKTLKATIYPGSCLPNQTASYVSSPGVLVEMSDISDHELRFVTDEGLAVGTPVAVIVTVCIIGVIVFIRRRYMSKKTDDNDLGQQDITPAQYPIDDKILYSQVSKGTQHSPSEDTQSPYSLSEGGVYDQTNERRHVVTNTDVYSHAVDTVYDSSEQHKRQDRREEIYDHVCGQKTDD